MIGSRPPRCDCGVREPIIVYAVSAQCRSLPILSRVFTMRSIIRKTLALAVAVFPTPLLAQGLTIQSITDVRFHGGLGTLMNIASKFGGGSLHDMPTTTYLSGHKIRSES